MPPAHSVIRACARPLTALDLRVDPAADFRRDLGALLRLKRTIVVDLVPSFPSKGPVPAGLAPWLAEAKKVGRTISTVEYCQASRGFGDWLSQVFGGGATARGYGAVRGYDVVLHADALDQVVTQVEFVPRGAAKP